MFTTKRLDAHHNAFTGTGINLHTLHNAPPPPPPEEGMMPIILLQDNSNQKPHTHVFTSPMLVIVYSLEIEVEVLPSFGSGTGSDGRVYRVHVSAHPDA
jgi:hypothetical protein